MSWLFRRLMCALGHHQSMRSRFDDVASWAECVDCGKRPVYVTHESVRRHIQDHMDAWEETHPEIDA